MKTKSILILTLSALFLGASLSCGSSMTAQTAGEVTRVALDRDTKTKTRKTSSNKKKKTTTVSYETEIDYCYTVDGKTFEGYSEKDGDVQREFAAGAPVVVCYNPKNPEESDVFAPGTSCGN